MQSLMSPPENQGRSKRSLRAPSFDRLRSLNWNGKFGKCALYGGIVATAWGVGAKATDFPITPINTAGIISQGFGYGFNGIGWGFEKIGDGLSWLDDFIFDGDSKKDGMTTPPTSTTQAPIQTLPPTTLPSSVNVGPTVPPFSPTAQTLPPIEVTTVAPAQTAPAAETPGVIPNSQGVFVVGAVTCSDQLQLVTIASGEYPFNAAKRVTHFPFDRLENDTTQTGDMVWNAIKGLPENGSLPSDRDLTTGDSFYAPVGCSTDQSYLLPE